MPFPFAAECDLVGGRRHVEFQVAAHLDRLCAQSGQALGIPRRLRGHPAEGHESRLHEGRKPAVSARRANRQAGVGEDHRHLVALGAGQQVWPDLGLHQDAKNRGKMAKKTIDRSRVIVGQIGPDDLVAIDLQPGLAAGRRHAGEQDAMIRPALAQTVDQRLGGARLADRDGMYPDQFFRPDRAIEAIALAEIAQVFRLFSAAPEQAQPDQRCQQIKQQRIEKARHQDRADCNSASTAAAGGLWSRPPRLRWKPVPRTPVRPGSVAV